MMAEKLSRKTSSFTTPNSSTSKTYVYIHIFFDFSRSQMSSQSDITLRFVVHFSRRNQTKSEKPLPPPTNFHSQIHLVIMFYLPYPLTLCAHHPARPFQSPPVPGPFPIPWRRSPSLHPLPADVAVQSSIE